MEYLTFECARVDERPRAARCLRFALAPDLFREERPEWDRLVDLFFLRVVGMGVSPCYEPEIRSTTVFTHHVHH
jgi:hypothetical protein